MSKLLGSALLTVLGASILMFCQEQRPGSRKPDSVVFREPFTLRLHVDRNHYYEEHYDRRIPYVAENDVYLFSGEEFGVNVDLSGGQIAGVRYQPDPKNADVWFKFEQPQKLGGSAMMLTIENKLKTGLRMDASMTVPGKKEVFKTSILPIEQGLSDFESWPHPIVQLVLRNFRTADTSSGKPQK